MRPTYLVPVHSVESAVKFLKIREQFFKGRLPQNICIADLKSPLHYDYRLILDILISPQKLFCYIEKYSVLEQGYVI